MSFHIIPVAEADVITLVKSIDRVIINPIIFFLFAVAMVYFLYGVAQYFMSSDNEEVRSKSKTHMIWGVIGLFIMVGVFGIMRILLNTVGENRIQVNSNGDFNVSGVNQEDNNNAPVLPDKPVLENQNSGKDLFMETEQMSVALQIAQISRLMFILLIHLQDMRQSRTCAGIITINLSTTKQIQSSML
jgi:hypothetical protein